MSRKYFPVSDDSYVPLFDGESAYLHAILLSHSCEAALYELLHEEGLCNDWLEFIKTVMHSNLLKRMCKNAIEHLLCSFPYDRFDFEFTGETQFRYINFDTDEPLHLAMLYPGDAGDRLTLFFTLYIELAQFHHISQTREYTWEQYMTDLMKGERLLDSAVCAFQKALADIDFDSFFREIREDICALYTLVLDVEC